MIFYFVLTYEHYYPDSNNVEAVFPTLEKAEQKCQEIQKQNYVPENIVIYTFNSETLEYSFLKDYM